MKFLNTKDKPLKVWMRFKPSSSDPLKYDLSVHHVTMRSVFASLVSLYENGRIAPQIASSWMDKDDKRTWDLKLNTSWTFSNGEKISPEEVLKSFKRVVLVKNKTDSNSGFLEYLKDFKKLNSLDDNIEGIKIINDHIVFNFIKPMPDFLEKVSFGLYSIVHSSQYDTEGKWIDNKKAISSGLYEISQWDKDNFELELRSDLNFIANASELIKHIVFNFSLDPVEVLKNDIILRERFNYLTDDSDWHYASTMEDSNIIYVKVMKWDDPKSLLSSKNTRKILRSLFYKNLENSGYKPIRSFFPLSIKGISEISDNNSLPVFSYESKKFTMPPFFAPLKSTKNKDKKELGEIYKLGFESFCNEIHAVPNYENYPDNEQDEKRIFEMQFLGTGINIYSPIEDVKFMFLSKHGIQLPDTSGEIVKVLGNNEVDLQLINEYLWDQAVIWPIRHYSQGFWVKKNSEVDLSRINLAMNPIDFQFLSWK
ncbi:MAG: ABC transporter substrate-binding protein [Bacteriovorax sp.]|jgi:hypothetical protein